MGEGENGNAIVSFLREFSRDKSTRDLLRTVEIRDLIIDVLAPKISRGDPVENLGNTICYITRRNKPAAELYSNRKSFSAILDCFHRAKTGSSAEKMSRSMYNICFYNPGANNILNDLPVVEAYSAMIPYATTNASVRWISVSVNEALIANEPAQKRFGTPTFLGTFLLMGKYATWGWSKSLFKKTIDTLQFIIDHSWSPESLRDASTPIELMTSVDALPRSRVCFTAEVRDAIIEKQNLIVDAPSADAVVSFLSEFSRIESARHLRTAEIRDLIIDVLAPKISGGDPVEKLGRTICNIVYQNKPAAELYSNRKSFSAILDCFHRAKTA